MIPIISPEEFMLLFPQAKLNIHNTEINNTLQQFIITYNHKLDKTWQTVSKCLKLFFKECGLELLGKNNMDILFWKTRGWDNPQQKVSNEVTNNLSNTSPSFWVTRGFSVEEAKEKASTFYKEKLKGKRTLPTQLDYYINKGQPIEDAINSLKKEQSKRTAKLVEKELKNPELRKRRLWHHIEYYLNRGYSTEVGYQLMAEKFRERKLQTLHSLTQKYINDGQDKTSALEHAKDDYKKRAKKSMNTKMTNNTFLWNQASKQSIKFFEPLMEKLDSLNIKYHIGFGNNEEFFLAKGNEYFYSYDFCIPIMKLIIEYNGEHIHPNPNMSIENWQVWRHCWTKKTADECREFDQQKIKIAEKNGYKVIEVFESDVISSLELITF